MCPLEGSQTCGRGGALEVHHVVKRAQGARTSISTGWCGALSAAPCADGRPQARGRLVITALGAGRFACEIIRGADRYAIRAMCREMGVQF